MVLTKIPDSVIHRSLDSFQSSKKSLAPQAILVSEKGQYWSQKRANIGLITGQGTHRWGSTLDGLRAADALGSSWRTLVASLLLPRVREAGRSTYYSPPRCPVTQVSTQVSAASPAVAHR